MKTTMDLRHRTWIAAIRLAAVISVFAAIVAIALSSIGHVSSIAIVIPIVVVAFVASWVQTGRVLRSQFAPISQLAPISIR
jgi:hypothetical protein